MGRILFYDKRLSDDGSMSCAGCHQQENSFDDPRPFSEGISGAFGDRNAMAIVNKAWASSLFWDGRQPSLEAQAHDPVVNPIELETTWPQVMAKLQADATITEMFFDAFGTRTVDSNLVTQAIAQFERTLVSFNSRYDHFVFEGKQEAFTEAEERGYHVYLSKTCNHCHSDVLLTDNFFRNNGLDANPVDSGRYQFTRDPADFGKFKVPTLRNIALTAPYMHDSRFNTLEEVIEHYSSGIVAASPNLDEHLTPFPNGLQLTQQEKDDLLVFLLALTDSSFISNTDFSEP